MGNVPIHPADMEPQLSIVTLSFDGRAREPLVFADVLQVAVAMLIEAFVLHEQTLNDLASLPHGDHCEILHIEIHCHGDEIGVLLALPHLAGFDLFALREMQLC